MAIKNGINQIAISGGGRLSPEINSVVPAMGKYNDIKHLMERNLVGMPLHREVVESIYLEGRSILRSTRSNPVKSAEVLGQFFTTCKMPGSMPRIRLAA